jgi:hypothetical protein
LIPSLNVLAIGGSHQLLHFLPVVSQLAANGRIEVRLFGSDAGACREIAELAEASGFPVPSPRPLPLPRWLELALPRRWLKGARIAWNARLLRSASALLSAERTSVLLKQLPGRCPPFLHIPHGAGDRAKGFERRLGLFDHILVAGPKDRERMIAEGVASASNCQVIGPIKVAALARGGAEKPRLFDNDRPVVLYQPHFDSRLGSFELLARRLIEWPGLLERYNLIVAPHIRLAERLDPAARRAFEGMARPGSLIVDFGSWRLVDMTYARAADLYLGDVSSQVYEFLVTPRPCLFVNTIGARWQDDPNYRMWQFGEVIAPEADLPAALERALAGHEQYRAAQQEGVAAALGLDPAERFDPEGVLDRAAALIERIVLQPR